MTFWKSCEPQSVTDGRLNSPKYDIFSSLLYDHSSGNVQFCFLFAELTKHQFSNVAYPPNSQGSWCFGLSQDSDSEKTAVMFEGSFLRHAHEYDILMLSKRRCWRF